ncbi:MAG: sulfotransferase family protein [Persicimonas sp.]
MSTSQQSESAELTTDRFDELVDRDQLPDFIIGGAMKSGTSSLRNVLREHPDIFIPPHEIHFFNVDEVDQEGEHFIHLKDGWVDHDWEADFEEYLAWYRTQFSDAREDQVIGEDTTTYLPSRKAPERIARLLPDVKLIFSLRDPVDRTYSHYWHRVRTGREVHDFETALEKNTAGLFRRSFYRESLERYLEHFDRDQIRVVLFEEYIESPQRVIDELCEFIGVEAIIDVEQTRSHSNRSTLPLHPNIRRAANWLRQWTPSMWFADHLPKMPGGAPQCYRHMRSHEIAAHVLAAGVDRILEWLPRVGYPPIEADTRVFLENVFIRENVDLSDLIGRDLASHWSGPW